MGNYKRDSKARILNLIYSWDPRKRPRGVATDSRDSNILADLEEQAPERLVSHLPAISQRVTNSAGGEGSREGFTGSLENSVLEILSSIWGL